MTFSVKCHKILEINLKKEEEMDPQSSWKLKV